MAELRSFTNGLPSRTNVCTRRKRTCGLARSKTLLFNLKFCGPYEIDVRYVAMSTATHAPLLLISLAAGESVTVEIGDIGMFDMTANPF